MAQSTEAKETPFRADPADELPVGVQLAWRLRALIAAGRLRPGDRMPSVRALAQWAGVNVNTVRGVYARLEKDGLVDTRHGRGSFVAESAAGSPEVERIAAEVIEAARAAGVDPGDVAKVTLVSAALPEGTELPDEPAEPDAIELERLAAELELDDSWLEADELAARRELRRQIGKLEAELASYRREDEPPARPRRIGDAAPRVAGTEELERTRDELLGRLAAARASAARRGLAERRARQARDDIVSDPSAHPWEVVSAAEAGEEGCREWEAAPWLGPLGTLMGWWRVKVSGGCP
jgi:DNA-binding transcriptional regulator YhcF (GntR family)